MSTLEISVSKIYTEKQGELVFNFPENTGFSRNHHHALPPVCI
jgi:hypothetical protein